MAGNNVPPVDVISTRSRSSSAVGSRSEIAAVAAVSAALAVGPASFLVFAPVKLNLTLYFAGVAALAAAGTVAVFLRVGQFSVVPRPFGLLPLVLCGFVVYLAAKLPAMLDATIAESQADITAGLAEVPNLVLLGLMGSFLCGAGVVAGVWLFGEELRDHLSDGDGEAVWLRRASLVKSATLIWFGLFGAGYFAWRAFAVMPAASG